MARPRAIIAMSGGVDSSVAAARLVDDGYEVIGVTLHLWDYDPDLSQKGRCCAPEDQHDAQRVADHLGIPHYTFDRRELFLDNVVKPFVDDYLGGRTPSPCVSCNRTVKIRELIPLAKKLGASKVATGHYARVVHEGGKAQLHRGRDAVKDQSYFLHMLRSDELEMMVFPLGETIKNEVREEAQQRRLPGADKGESQELCFVQAGRYDGFVQARADGRVRPGRILGFEGQAVAQHEGVHRFTVGQRRGIGVALGKPAFVVGIDAKAGEVRLGEEKDLYSRVAVLADPVFPKEVRFPLEADVQVRARHAAQPAVIRQSDDGSLLAIFDGPARAVAPGQIAVAYDGNRVLGGATIVSANTNPPETVS